MAITSVATGSISASTTETTISASQTTSGTYVLMLDLNNMAAGDVIEITTYAKATTAGTERLLDRVSFVNAQGQPIFQSVPIINPFQLTFKIKQPVGLGKSVSYTILTL
jgi:hypothetical protein